MCRTVWYLLSQLPATISKMANGTSRIKITESQNHRMVGVGRDLCGSSSPTKIDRIKCYLNIYSSSSFDLQVNVILLNI